MCTARTTPGGDAHLSDSGRLQRLRIPLFDICKADLARVTRARAKASRGAMLHAAGGLAGAQRGAVDADHTSVWSMSVRGGDAFLRQRETR